VKGAVAIRARRLDAVSHADGLLSGHSHSRCVACRSFLKQMLDEKLDLHDLKDVDAALHKGLMQYLSHPLAALGMDDMTFTTEKHFFGTTEVAELKPGGADIIVRLCWQPHQLACALQTLPGAGGEGQDDDILHPTMYCPTTRV
jgi:hypothetical protein